MRNEENEDERLSLSELAEKLRQFERINERLILYPYQYAMLRACNDFESERNNMTDERLDEERRVRERINDNSRLRGTPLSVLFDNEWTERENEEEETPTHESIAGYVSSETFTMPNSTYGSFIPPEYTLNSSGGLKCSKCGMPIHISGYLIRSVAYTAICGQCTGEHITSIVFKKLLYVVRAMNTNETKIVIDGVEFLGVDNLSITPNRDGTYKLTLETVISEAELRTVTEDEINSN